MQRYPAWFSISITDGSEYKTIFIAPYGYNNTRVYFYSQHIPEEIHVDIGTSQLSTIFQIFVKVI